MGPALSVAREAARGLISDGAAEAVVLVGSHARGEAGPLSDVDLLCVGRESYMPRLDLRDGVLVSVSAQPLDVHRESFRLPELVCEAVPGWRGALILEDPKGLAAALVGEARGWTWDALEGRCDAWVAEELVARAETVQKLVSALEGGRDATAAVKRALICSRLARALAVHRRVLYGSENRLWDLVADAMGEGWRTAQRAALGLDGRPFEGTCAAALRLYHLAADEVGHLLDERQERVVRHARALAGPTGRSRGHLRG